MQNTIRSTMQISYYIYKQIGKAHIKKIQFLLPVLIKKVVKSYSSFLIRRNVIFFRNYIFWTL